MKEYKGYIKLAESVTGETIVGPKRNVKNWQKRMIKSFDEELSFENLSLSKSDKAYIDLKELFINPQ